MNSGVSSKKTSSCKWPILAKTSSRITTTITFSRQNDSGSRVENLVLVVVLVSERVPGRSYGYVTRIHSGKTPRRDQAIRDVYFEYPLYTEMRADDTGRYLTMLQMFGSSLNNGDMAQEKAIWLSVFFISITLSSYPRIEFFLLIFGLHCFFFFCIRYLLGSSTR